MKQAKVFHTGGSQAVRLPKEFRFDTDEVAIRKEGAAVILEPIKRRSWPRGFFRKIRIGDPAFRRPDQGETPDSPSLETPPGK